MIIALGVWGSSVRFKNSDERWSGQSEYVAFINYLLSLQEVDEVVMIGKHDEHFPDHHKFTPFGKKKYPKADAAYVFQSQGAACISTIPGYRWVPNPLRRTKVLAMAENYAAPITDYLNVTKIPWIYMATDPRYIDMIKPADISNHPACVLGSADAVIKKWKHIDKYLPYEQSAKVKYTEHTNTVVTYGQLQKLNLFTPLSFELPKRKITRFAMILNKCLDVGYRSQQAQVWLPKGTDLYGNLEVPGFDNKFVSSSDLDTVFSRVKYTLVMPLYDKPIGNYSTGLGKRWMTYKPYEMIRLGVVPFLHPDYDQDNRFCSPLNNYQMFLRVANQKQLLEKMDFLDSNPVYKEELMNDLRLKLAPPTTLIKYAKQII